MQERELAPAADKAVVDLLAKAREQRGLRFPETARRSAERRAALDSLGRDCRREERRTRIGWLAAAAILLTTATALVSSDRVSGVGTKDRETLALAVELPSFPRDPFSLEFEVASAPTEGSTPQSPLRSTLGTGPQIVAPKGSITERRPEIRFESGQLPDAFKGSLSVSLLHTLGHEVAAEVIGRGELCRALPTEDLVEGEWIVTVRLDHPEVDWSARARFVVGSMEQIELLLEGLEETGDADLDGLIAAAALVDAGFAELAQEKLAQVGALGGSMRARAALIEARAARVLEHEERLEELRVEWHRLRSSSSE